LTQLHVSVACICAVAEKRSRQRAEAKHSTLATILTYLSLIYSLTRATYLVANFCRDTQNILNSVLYSTRTGSFTYRVLTLA